MHVYASPKIRMIEDMTPYCTNILDPSLMFDSNEKLIYAEARAPQLDINTKNAAEVPRLLCDT